MILKKLICINTLLTVEMLKAIAPKSIFAVGETVNSPEGVFMTDECIDRELTFVAVRGGIHDWAIYIGWSDMGVDWIKDYGDKLYDSKYIRELVPCDEEAFKMYRE